MNEKGPTRPPGDYSQQTALVVDEANGQLLFFDPVGKAMLVWSAGTWVPALSPTSWPAIGSLSSGGVAYDPDRHEVLIVTSGAPDLETLTWNGHAFVTLSSHSGLPDSKFFLVPDGRGHMFAFGQDDVGGPTSSASWDGKAWSLLSSAATLPPQVDSVAFDPAHQVVLAVGSGYDGIFHTWRWQANSWKPIATTLSPPVGRVSNLAYDPVLSSFVITVLPAATLGGII